jgi:hypothetical protein
MPRARDCSSRQAVFLVIGYVTEIDIRQWYEAIGKPYPGKIHIAVYGGQSEMVPAEVVREHCSKEHDADAVN